MTIHSTHVSVVRVISFLIMIGSIHIILGVIHPWTRLLQPAVRGGEEARDLSALVGLNSNQITIYENIPFVTFKNINTPAKW